MCYYTTGECKCCFITRKKIIVFWGDDFIKYNSFIHLTYTQALIY